MLLATGPIRGGLQHYAQSISSPGGPNDTFKVIKYNVHKLPMSRGINAVQNINASPINKPTRKCLLESSALHQPYSQALLYSEVLRSSPMAVATGQACKGQ